MVFEVHHPQSCLPWCLRHLKQGRTLNGQEEGRTLNGYEEEWCFVITFRESLRCFIRGKPESSNWLVLYDQSEIIKVLKSARGLYKKSEIEEISVAARQSPDKDSWMQRCKLPAEEEHQVWS